MTEKGCAVFQASLKLSESDRAMIRRYYPRSSAPTSESGGSAFRKDYCPRLYVSKGVRRAAPRKVDGDLTRRHV